MQQVDLEKALPRTVATDARPKDTGSSTGTSISEKYTISGMPAGNAFPFWTPGSIPFWRLAYALIVETSFHDSTPN